MLVCVSASSPFLALRPQRRAVRLTWSVQIGARTTTLHYSKLTTEGPGDGTQADDTRGSTYLPTYLVGTGRWIPGAQGQRGWHQNNRDTRQRDVGEAGKSNRASDAGGAGRDAAAVGGSEKGRAGAMDMRTRLEM